MDLPNLALMAKYLYRRLFTGRREGDPTTGFHTLPPYLLLSFWLMPALDSDRLSITQRIKMKIWSQKMANKLFCYYHGPNQWENWWMSIKGSTNYFYSAIQFAFAFASMSLSFYRLWGGLISKNTNLSQKVVSLITSRKTVVIFRTPAHVSI